RRGTVRRPKHHQPCPLWVGLSIFAASIIAPSAKPIYPNLNMNIRTFVNDLRASLQRLYRERTEYTTYILELLVGLVVCFVTLYGFIELTELLVANNIAWFDDAVSAYIHGLRSPTLTPLMIALTQLGDAIAYIVLMLCVVVYFYFRRKNWTLSIQIAI